MTRERMPALGPRGEGWVVGQFALGVVIVATGLIGPGWSTPARIPLLVAGIVIGIAGLGLFVAGVAALGGSLSPFPRPSEGARLEVGGIYGRVRHPIYGGVLLVALGWSLMLSPLALVPSVLLLVLLELKSRHEESMLAERYPGYEGYRRLVRWRFVPGVR
jgi:protein-S-isoprenylcysteine O-methyltransferase Ste14